MHRRHGAALLGMATVAAVTGALVSPVGSATAEPGTRPAHSQVASASDQTQVGPDYNNGKPLPASAALRKAMRAQNGATAKAAEDAHVGDTVNWLALNDYTGQIYLKPYTLKGIGEHIEVWVADNTAFPDGDCRNDLGMTDITQAQVDSFVQEFDNNIFPKESASFSVPPSRDGSAEGAYGAGPVSADQADDIVTLVDNVRDANFYDPSTPDGQTFIAGFFYSVFNDYTDRNIMTIDANDWLHRTGANPPDDSEDPAYIACAQSQGYDRGYGSPRPRDYEGTFAHEYQHLLESYVDPDEDSWVNEGLSDYAQSLVGYVDTALPPTAPDFDSHIGCFEGYLPESYGGAENSLTLWQDQGGPEVLCDYGAAYSFMMYLFSHYGEDFMSQLHTEPGNGIKGLNAVLKDAGASRNATQTIHDWIATMALDAAVDDSGKLTGGPKGRYTADSLSARINWANPQSFDSPGAPPNGADYVRLGKPGHWLKSKQIDALRFKGASSLAPTPVEWTVDTTPPDATTEDTTCGAVEDGTGAAALYSGCGENLDRSLVRQVTVPAGGGTLSFEALWDTEEQWDYGFVQVSTDGGKTWTSLSTEDTTSEHDPGAVGNIVSELPGFTGDSGEWKTETADLSAYAGKKIMLGFRYITDSGVNEGGFWVRGIDVAGTSLPSDSLAGWKTITQVHPVEVPDWTVQLVGIDKSGKASYHDLKIDKSFRGSLTGKQLRKALGSKATTVAALVTMDDKSQTITQYGKYTLTVKAPVAMGNRSGR
ncbi:choice-of-anchor J domain-containing protein [Nocardioides sp.]|uniref:choice-of-anchor J domain-containing protein n=1 Tax=Nocardioides sp. TaxID=35761 RepID=UPI0037832A51